MSVLRYVEPQHEGGKTAFSGRETKKSIKDLSHNKPSHEKRWQQGVGANVYLHQT